MKTYLVKFKWNRVRITEQDDGSRTYSWAVFRHGVEIPVDKPLPDWLKSYVDRVLTEADAPSGPATKPGRVEVTLTETNYRYVQQCASRAGLSVDAWLGRLIGGHKTRKGWNR